MDIDAQKGETHMENEVYEVYDNQRERSITGLKRSKRHCLDLVQKMNRDHAIKTVNAILMMKAPKRGNKDKVQELAISIADGRYSLKTTRVS